MADWLVLIKDIALPVGGGIASGVGAVWKYSRAVIHRIEKRIAVVEAQLKEMDATIDASNAKVREMEQSDKRSEKEIESIKAEVYRFIEEQGDRWMELNRTLGRIEGYAQGRDSVHEIAAPSSTLGPRAPRPPIRR